MARVVYFGPVWWALTTLPLLVAGYATSRHLYLALAGVAIVLALIVDALWQSPARVVRVATSAAAGVLLLFWVWQQQTALAGWNTAARISHQMVRQLESTATAEPPGTLLLLDAPAVFVAPSLPGARAVGRPWIWSWALPYPARPPYASRDLFAHLRLVSTLPAYCCGSERWLLATRTEIARWTAEGAINARAIQWDATTGAMRTWSGGTLAAQVRRLSEAPDAPAMTRALREIFGD